MALRTIVFLIAVVMPSVALAQIANPAPATLGVRIAAFSPQRAFAESADGKSVLSKLSSLQTERNLEVQKRNKELESQEAAFEQSGTFLSGEARRQRTRELEKMRLDVQRFIQDAQAELMGIQRDAESAFVAKLNPIVAQLAKERELEAILNLDSPLVIWLDQSLDLTSEVLRRLSQ